MASKREGKGKLILWALRPSATTHSSHSHSQTSPAFNPSAGCVLFQGHCRRTVGWWGREGREGRGSVVLVGRETNAVTLSPSRPGLSFPPGRELLPSFVLRALTMEATPKEQRRPSATLPSLFIKKITIRDKTPLASFSTAAHIRKEMQHASRRDDFMTFRVQRRVLADADTFHSFSCLFCFLFFF